MKLKNKIISVNEFSALHPFNDKIGPFIIICDTDTYFTKVANKIMRELEKDKLITFSPIFIRTLALRTTGYFEDIISNWGLFAGFRKLCDKLIGKKIPWFDIPEDYLEDEINFIDVQFLVWATLQEDVNRLGKELFITVKGTILKDITSVIYEILDSEYEIAPENDSVYKILHTFEYSDLYTFRECLSWLYSSSYLSMNYTMQDLLKAEADIKKELKLSKDFNPNTLHYMYKSNAIMLKTCTPIAVRAIEWFEVITTNEKMLKKIKNFDSRKMMAYKIIESDADNLFLETFDEKPEKFKLTINSINEMEREKIGDFNNKVMHTTLTYFDDVWWVNGFSSFMDFDADFEKQQKQIIKQKEEKDELLNCNYETFIKNNNNEAIAFAENFDEWTQVWGNIFQDNKDKKIKGLDSFKTKKDFVLFCDKDTGIQTMPSLAKIVKHPDNKFYDRLEAEKSGFIILTGGVKLPLEFLEFLIDNNYIPDITIEWTKDKQSQADKQSDKQIIQSHLGFIIRFFQPYLFDKALFLEQYNINKIIQNKKT